MVDQWTVTKPSRSDEVLEAAQQQQITSQVRAHFDSLAPKRPTKPDRSEPGLTATASYLSPAADQSIPELDKLRSLQSKSHVNISVGGDTVVQDEFVETQYYRELDSIEKEHHTTGSGFIRVTREDDGNECFLQLENGRGAGNVVKRPTFITNPARNDWIPKAEEDQVFM